MQGREIHLCVCGGVAAYKAVELARWLVRAGARVRVAMTPSARQFVGPLTFQAVTHSAVLTETLDATEEMEIGHIAFAQRCDALVVAPATANVIGKAAHGIGDEIVSTVLLAANVPVLVAPAMNTYMYENPAVQGNLALLAARGWTVVEPTAGELACGQVGPGRMAEPETIGRAVEALLTPKRLFGRRVVVTAGPTREHFDPVRFLSNPSTGRAGIAIAEAARHAGADVTLIHGPVTVPLPAGVRAVPVTSAVEMHAAVMAVAPDADAVVMTAAVADYRPETFTPQKARKGEAPQQITLVRNPDILAELGARRAGARPVLVGFAAETGDPVDSAREKLARKRVDLVVANDVSAEGSGFGVDTNRVWLVSDSGVEALPLLSKRAVAERVAAFVAERLESDA